MRNVLAPAVACLALVACSVDAPLGIDEAPAVDAFTAHRAPGERSLKVMTQNLYVGADVDPILGAQDPTLIPVLVAEAFATVVATDFPARAQAIADIIGRAQPHLIGLQEVSRILVQSPGDFLIGNPQPATDVAFDFLEILMAALKSRGLDYRVVVEKTNADVELPSATGDDVRLIDADAILARGDVVTANPAAAHFAVNLIVPSPGPGLPDIAVLRAWTAVDARVGHTTVRFVNTHLEPFLEIVQLAQTAELLAIFGREIRPVVMVGDFNSAADGSGTASYGNIVASGYADAWNLTFSRKSGLTCCQAADLRNAVSRLQTRIDLVFARDGLDAGFRGNARTIVVGDEPRERTSSGLWPSDHAGVVSTLFLTSNLTVADGS